MTSSLDPFKALDERYPGSKETRAEKRPDLVQKARGKKADVGEDDAESWDRPANRRTYVVKGERQEFFVVQGLAEALNRKPVTIRKWERLGMLPKAMYRTPSRGGVAGMRLYTRAQIEGIVAIAEEEGVLLNTDFSPLSTTRFTERVVDLFKTLHKSNK